MSTIGSRTSNPATAETPRLATNPPLRSQNSPHRVSKIPLLTPCRGICRARCRDTYPRTKTSLYSRTYTEGSDPFEPSYYIISAVMRLWCGRNQTAAKSATVPGRKGLSQRHFISYISNRPAIGRSIPPHPAANFR